MRYFFHVVRSGTVYEDNYGREFGKSEDAIAHADIIARELAMDGSFGGVSIRVVDEEKNEISRMPIDSRRSTH
jgi:hypothetical protein